MHGGHDDTADGEKLDRRRVLELGAVGLVGLPRYATVGRADERNSRQDEGTPVTDEWTGITVTGSPENFQYNPYNLRNFDGETAAAIWDPLTHFNPATGEFVPFVAAEWSFDDAGGTVALREEYTWNDGDPVTAADVVTQLKIDEYVEETIWEFISDVEVRDDYEFEVTLDGRTNERILEHLLLPTQVNAPRAVYGEYLERLEDATTDEEVDDVLSELTEYAPEEPPLTNGPFAFLRATERKVTLEKYDGYANGYIAAEDINFSTFGVVDGGAGRNQILIAENEADGGLATLPQEMYADLDDHWGHIDDPAYNGLGLAFQLEHELLGDRRVRQAFAYLLPRRPIIANNAMGYMKTPHEYVCGLDPTVVDDWLGDVKADLTSYAWEEQRVEEATALLEDAGLRNEGGRWLGPDGDPFRPGIKVRTGASEWVAAVQMMIGYLNDAGVQAEMITREDATFVSEFNEGDFTLAAHWWGGWSAQGHPYFSYGNLEDLDPTLTGGNMQPEVEVPMPIGDLGGDLETVDVEEELAELARTSDEAEQREIVERLAWTYNQYLPRYPIQTHTQTFYYRTDRWEAPAKDDEDLRYSRPSHIWLRLGELSAKEE